MLLAALPCPATGLLLLSHSLNFKFLLQIDCAKRLKHPHIANLLDVVAHDGNLALAVRPQHMMSKYMSLLHTEHALGGVLSRHIFSQRMLGSDM